LGKQIKTAGWDGVLIHGRADTPVRLEIDRDGVRFVDAAEMWGMDAVSAHRQLVGKRRGVAVIGPAGENRVLYANVLSGGRFFGRGGMGAVLGAKHVKAVVATGGAYRIVPADSRRFTKAKERANRYINRNPMTAIAYRRYGTAATVNMANRGGILPVRNFTSGADERSADISGEAYARHQQTRKSTCKPCAIMCGHSGRFDGRQRRVPEYETLGLLGSNLGVFDRSAIAEFNDACEEMGLDTISTGGSIAWMMEATAKGLIQSYLKFGDQTGILRAIHEIGRAKGLGKALGLGSKRLADKYGGHSFAIQVKGMELSAYDPRGSVGQGLAFAVANRGGCHLSAYIVALEVLFGLLDPYTRKAKVEFTIFFENLNNCINSITTCLFTQYAYTFEVPLIKYTPRKILSLMMQHLPRLAVKLIDFSIYADLWSSVTGIKISNGEFIEAGERIHVLERLMNTEEGIRRVHDGLPKRLAEEPLSGHPGTPLQILDTLIDRYYRRRGYRKDGVPDEALLKRLKIPLPELNA
jgi:aldehyde:ferredoxin oxidoreductase